MPVMALWKLPIPANLTWEHALAQALGRHRRRTPEDRFARRLPRKTVVIVGVLLFTFGVLIATGGAPDANHDVLVVKRLPRVSP